MENKASQSKKLSWAQIETEAAKVSFWAFPQILKRCKRYYVGSTDDSQFWTVVWTATLQPRKRNSLVSLFALLRCICAKTAAARAGEHSPGNRLYREITVTSLCLAEIWVYTQWSMSVLACISVLVFSLCSCAWQHPSSHLWQGKGKWKRENMFPKFVCVEREEKTPVYEEQSPLLLQMPGVWHMCPYVVAKKRFLAWDDEACWGVKAKTTFSIVLCHINGLWVTLPSWFTFCHYAAGDREEEISWVFSRMELKAYVLSFCSFITICTVVYTGR